MEISFKGKVVLVTGSGEGIGRATAQRFAEAGAKVVLNALTDAYLPSFNRELASRGFWSRAVVGDISSPETIEGLREAVREAGGLDVLVNNASVEVGKPFEELTLEEARRMHEVNVLAYYATVKAFFEELKRSRGCVVNVSSVQGLNPESFTSYYPTTKGAELTLTRELAMALAKYGIRVNAVAPGPIDTPHNRKKMGEMSGGDYSVGYERMSRGIPMKRFGAPEEVANAILFLAWEGASYITGATLFVDGGTHTVQPWSMGGIERAPSQQVTSSLLYCTNLTREILPHFLGGFRVCLSHDLCDRVICLCDASTSHFNVQFDGHYSFHAVATSVFSLRQMDL